MHKKQLARAFKTIIHRTWTHRQTQTAREETRQNKLTTCIKRFSHTKMIFHKLSENFTPNRFTADVCLCIIIHSTFSISLYTFIYIIIMIICCILCHILKYLLTKFSRFYSLFHFLILFFFPFQSNKNNSINSTHYSNNRDERKKIYMYAYNRYRKLLFKT